MSENQNELERRRAYQREYYAKNKKRLNERAANWRKNNPDKVRTSKQNWWVANKEDSKKKHQKWQLTLKGRLCRKLYHLKKHKNGKVREVNIDVDFLLNLWNSQDGKCAISDYPMSFTESNLFGVSIDRIDSNGGYTKDNVQLVCQGINFAKNKFSNEDIKEFWNYRTKLEI